MDGLVVNEYETKGINTLKISLIHSCMAANFSRYQVMHAQIQIHEH